MSIDLPDLPPLTDRVRDLTESELFALRCVRRRLAGGGHYEILARTLAAEMRREHARKILARLEAIVRVLGMAARRNLAYHQPCCPCLGPDEALLLTFVAAAQNDQLPLARFLASEAVAPCGIERLVGAGREFGAALARGGHHLPLRAVWCAPTLETNDAASRGTARLH
jgi:hypothetical protein